MTNLIQRLFGKHKISREEILSSANDISEIVADLFGVPTTGFNVRVAASSSLTI